MNPLVIPKIYQPSIPDDIHWGIDGEKFVFPVNNELSLPLDSKWEPKPGRKLEDDTPTVFYVADIPLGKYKMKAIYWEISSQCTIDFNPAHSLFGENELLLPPGANSRMIEQAILATGVVPGFAQIDQEGTITWPSNWLDWVRISELEVSRNFLIAPNYKKPLELTLKSIRPPRNYQRQCVEEGEGFSLYFNSKSVGRDFVYDKTVEMKVKRAQQVATTSSHIYRFEARLNSSRLKKHELQNPAQVTDANVWQAISGRFHACGFNVTLTDAGSLIRKLQGVRYQEVEQLLGYNEAVRLGLDKGMSKAVRRDRRLLSKNYGITPGLEIRTHASEKTALDLGEGRLVHQPPI